MSISNFRCNLLLIIVLKLALSFNVSFANDIYVTPSNLIEIINTENLDNLLKTLNDIKQMKYQGDILPVLKDLWLHRIDKYEITAPEVVSNDIFRVEVANILLQAFINGAIDIERDAFHDYILSSIKSENIEVKMRSISTLKLFDQESDVPIIEKIAMEQAVGTFRVSVIALAFMCNEKALVALNNLEMHVSPDNKLAIIEIRNKMEDLKRKSNLCKYKKDGMRIEK